MINLFLDDNNTEEKAIKPILNLGDDDYYCRIYFEKNESVINLKSILIHDGLRVEKDSVELIEIFKRHDNGLYEVKLQDSTKNFTSHQFDTNEIVVKFNIDDVLESVLIHIETLDQF